MSATIWADVLDKMYDLVIEEPYIAAEVAAERLKVFDGPSVSDFSARTMMTIGALPVEEDESETTSTWDWSSLGRDGANADVDDALSVPCGISTRLGDSADLRRARRVAINVFDKASAFYRGTTLNLPAVMWCIPQMSSLSQLYTQSGSECMITFLVHVRTRI